MRKVAHCIGVESLETVLSQLQFPSVFFFAAPLGPNIAKTHTGTWGEAQSNKKDIAMIVNHHPKSVACLL